MEKMGRMVWWSKWGEWSTRIRIGGVHGENGV